jgi:hypothetical protein
MLSGGRCDCKREDHDHPSRCTAKLVWLQRGSDEPGGWEAHHIDVNGAGTLRNCEILCLACYNLDSR